jgi:hypothetical protein
MYRVDHAIEDWVQDGACLLGVAVAEEFERALQVCQQHGDLFALSLESVPALEDFCRKEGRWLRLREANGRPRGESNGPAAPPAEFRVDLVGELADRADLQE